MSSWFDFVDPSCPLSQGDILYACPVFFPDPKEDYTKLEDPATVDFVFAFKDVIVMTQSCDIQQGQPDFHILLCPLNTIDQVPLKNMGNLVADKIGRMQLLNKHDSEHGYVDYNIVDFTKMYTVPLGVINNWKNSKEIKRPRLLSPYNELMSQRFGMKIMRIGIEDTLKIDISDLNDRWETLQKEKNKLP